MSQRYINFYILILLVLFSCSSILVSGKSYMRCQLTRELIQKYKINKTYLPSWICMVEHESNLDTRTVKEKPNGSKSFGLFQISNSDACRIGRAGGFCNKKCEDFINDNIDDDVECAKLIQERHGFKYWQGWNTSCRNSQNLPNLGTVCNIHSLSAYISK